MKTYLKPSLSLAVILLAFLIFSCSKDDDFEEQIISQTEEELGEGPTIMGADVDFFNTDIGTGSTLDFQFSTDGTKLFTLRSTFTEGYGEFIAVVIDVYSLNTPFVLASITGSPETFTTPTEANNPSFMKFSNDGTKLFLTSSETEFGLTSYNLSSAYNLNTLSYAGGDASYNFSSETTSSYLRGFEVSNDGSKLYSVELFAVIAEYNLTTNFDVSTIEYAGEEEEIKISDNVRNLLGITFSTDGTQMFTYEYSKISTFNLSTANDVSTAVFAGENKILDIAGDELIINDLEFSNDGTIAFVLGSRANSIIRYELTTPFDLSTAKSFLTNSELVVSSETTGPRDVIFTNSGTEMYVLGVYGDIFKYDLTTAFDVSTSVFNSQVLSRSDLIRNTYGARLNNDGTKLFISTNDLRVLEYTLSTPYDFSTLSYAGDDEYFDYSSEEEAGIGLAFNTNGTKMYLVGATTDVITEYNLSTAFDVSSAIKSKTLDVSSESTNPRAIAFNLDGTKMFIIDTIKRSVLEYDLNTGYDISTANYSGESEDLLIGVLETSPYSLTFNDDGTKLFVGGDIGDAILEYSLSTPFDVSTATTN